MLTCGAKQAGSQYPAEVLLPLKHVVEGAGPRRCLRLRGRCLALLITRQRLIRRLSSIPDRLWRLLSCAAAGWASC